MSVAYDDTLFRTQFPEFSDTTQYPETLLSMYWDMATNFIDPTDCCMWNVLTGSSLAYALNCMTAQLLTLGQMAQTTSPPGSDQGGFIISAEIGEIKVAKQAPPTSNMWSWWLSQTPYGQQLLALLQMLGVGGLSVGGLAERNAFRKVGGVFW